MFSFTIVCFIAQAILVQNAYSQYVGGMGYGYGPDIGLGPAFGPGYGIAPGVAGVECAGVYGGAGVGDVGVAGELPVVGTTLVAGQVPILGAVRFAGDLPAAGVVTITGSCGCGCGAPGPYYY